MKRDTGDGMMMTMMIPTIHLPLTIIRLCITLYFKCKVEVLFMVADWERVKID